MSNPQPARQKKVLIEVPKELEAIYANVAFITHTPAEMVLDFAQVLPRMPRGKIVSRVLMSPMHAKAFMQALAQNVANYERQFGEIKIPKQQSIADQFFRFTPPQANEGDGDGDDKE